jgi:importin subunit alpha-1
MSKQSLYPQLQLEATWVLTNVCSGSTAQCESVIDKGGIPIFIQLLHQNRPGIVDQAVWAIGNLSGDCVSHRDKIIQAGAIQHLIKISNTTKDKNLIRQVAWTLSNLCRGVPLPKYELIKNGIAQLCLIVKAGVLDR